MNDHELDKIAKDFANKIIERLKKDNEYDGIESNLVHEFVTESPYVSNYSKAHEICQNCNTDSGEDFLDNIGITGNMTYNEHARLLAWGELHARVMDEYEKLMEEVA